MTLINGNSHSTTDSWKMSWDSTIEEVVIPIEKRVAFKIKKIAYTNIGNYSVSTIQKAEDWFETDILCNSCEDECNIGRYTKRSTNSKTALNHHIEAIWHIHHSCREGL